MKTIERPRTARQSAAARDRQIIDDFVRASELEEQAGDFAAAGEIRRAARSQLAADQARCRAMRSRLLRSRSCGTTDGRTTP